jgi:uncharacterized protein YuzE
MYLERDGDFDQLYVNFSGRIEKGVVAETVEAVSGVNLDLDRDGRLIGVEIVGAKDVIGTPASELDLSGELLGVKEAAELAGKDRANFLRDLASREDFPKPIARFASGPCWLSSEVARYFRIRHRAAG